MDRQRSQAIDTLEISNDSVKCQRCTMAVPIVGKLTSTGNDGIAVLRKRIKWLENYHYAPQHHHQLNINKDNNVKLLKAELAARLKEDAAYDKQRSLPLYSCRITGWKFVCSICYDKAYASMRRKKERNKISSPS